MATDAKDMLEALDPSRRFDFKNNMIHVDGYPVTPAFGGVDMVRRAVRDLSGWSEYVERLGFDPSEHPDLRVPPPADHLIEIKQPPYPDRYLAITKDGDAVAVKPEDVHPFQLESK